MKFDVRMSVVFCDKHKRYYEERVKVKIDKNKELGIIPVALTKLLASSAECTECHWETIFGKEKG